MEVDLAQHRSPQLQDLGQCHSHIFHSRDYSLCVLKVPNGNAIRTGAKRPLKRDCVRISKVRNSGNSLGTTTYS